MSLQVYNTLTREKEEFIPHEKGKVSLYVCGITPYDYCHLGHARVYLTWDVIKRYFTYLGYQVYHVQNFTDIDDKIIKRANEEGFLVTYNHPVWSNQYYPDYITLEGIWALEIRNTHNCMIGINENNALVYRDFLHEGRRMCVVAADDTHRTHTIGGSFTMIGAKELTYASVIEAMEKGDVYASCGPLIHSLSLDGTSLRITCDTAAEILLETQTRHAQRATGGITEAEFDLSVWMEKSKANPDAYIRLTVIAPDGSYAATRAYFMDELGV